jgi:hypothetical protein
MKRDRDKKKEGDKHRGETVDQRLRGRRIGGEKGTDRRDT